MHGAKIKKIIRLLNHRGYNIIYLF